MRAQQPLLGFSAYKTYPDGMPPGMYHRTGTVSFLLSGPQTISVHRAAAVPGKQLHAASRNRQPDPFQQIYSAVMSESVKVSL